jgi:hypothetical protein
MDGLAGFQAKHGCEVQKNGHSSPHPTARDLTRPRSTLVGEADINQDIYEYNFGQSISW